MLYLLLSRFNLFQLAWPHLLFVVSITHQQGPGLSRVVHCLQIVLALKVILFSVLKQIVFLFRKFIWRGAFGLRCRCW